MARCTPVKLAYKRYDPDERSDRTPVIFIHGMTALKENWGTLPEATAKQSNRTVYAVDLRNHGDSPWSEEWSFDVNADDVIGFMDEHHIAKAILVGHSMGGVTSFKTGLRAPERVERIFIEDMTTKPIEQNLFNTIIAYLELAQDVTKKVPPHLEHDEAIEFALKIIVEHLPPEIKPKVQHDPRDEIVRLRKNEEGRWQSKANLDVLIRGAKDCASLVAPYEGTYEGPVTVICGGQSPFKPADDMDIIRQNFPKAELVLVEHATHTVHSDCPNEFRQALKDFLH